MANYTIDVNFNQSGSNSNTDNFSIPSIGDKSNQSFNVLNQVFNKISGAFAPVTIAKEVAEVTGEYFKWKASLIGRNTGSQIAQEKANAIMSIANGLKNPLSFGISLLKEIEQSEYDRSIEYINRSLLRERVGASFNRSRDER